MSQLHIRKIPFAFEGVDFIWNRQNPYFSVSMNLISFYAPALERYFVKSMIAAEPLIKSLRVKEEARLFRLQEGQHAKAHRLHTAELIKSHPGLQRLEDRYNALLDDLFETRDIKFHLGFMAEMEASFTPLFKMIIDHRRELFSQGDSRVASLMLWHFCEEIEHRSSAVMVYNDVVDSHWYRVSLIPELYRIHLDVTRIAIEEFRQAIPDLPADYLKQTKGYRSIPLWSVCAFFLRLSYSQMPWYNHETQSLPKWALKWFEHYERGDDMRTFYGIPPGQ